MADLKQKILAEVEADLKEIEIELSENLKPYLDLVSEVAHHILFSGGKRLRPLLLVLSAKLCGYDGDYAKTISTALEYLHAATLLHDDIVDDATLRRGKKVAHSVYGSAITVLVGDFLLARALSISVDSGNFKVIDILSELTEIMSSGEIHQLMRKGDIDLTEDEYLEVIEQKTACLFQTACRVSAVIADAPGEKENALSDYGYNLGIAFQMADDLFDYTLDTADLGKEVGADLREGKLTLPVIHALKQAIPADREQMVTIIQDEDFTADEFKILVQLLKKYEGIAYTEKKAASYIKKAKNALSIFEPSKTKETMIDVADYVLARRI